MKTKAEYLAAAEAIEEVIEHYRAEGGGAEHFAFAIMDEWEPRARELRAQAAAADARMTEPVGELVEIPDGFDGSPNTVFCEWKEARWKMKPGDKLYSHPAPAPAEPVGDFQLRVRAWMLECFGVEISNDRTERNHRFLEESLELVQALGCTQSEAHQLVDYVFNRPVGEPTQEVGGVMVTLAALCLANSMDMATCGEVELNRIWGKVEQIRAKQAAKPKHSPLPEHTAPAPAGVPDVAGLQRYAINCKIGAYKKCDTGFWVKHRDVAPALAALQSQLAGAEQANNKQFETINTLREYTDTQAQKIYGFEQSISLRDAQIAQQAERINALKAKLAEAVGLLDKAAKSTSPFLQQRIFNFLTKAREVMG